MNLQPFDKHSVWRWQGQGWALLKKHWVALLPWVLLTQLLAALTAYEMLEGLKAFPGTSLLVWLAAMVVEVAGAGVVYAVLLHEVWPSLRKQQSATRLSLAYVSLHKELAFAAKGMLLLYGGFLVLAHSAQQQGELLSVMARRDWLSLVYLAAWAASASFFLAYLEFRHLGVPQTAFARLGLSAPACMALGTQAKESNPSASQLYFDIEVFKGLAMCTLPFLVPLLVAHSFCTSVAAASDILGLGLPAEQPQPVRYARPVGPLGA